MKKKKLRLIGAILAALCLIPIPLRMKDGGTVKYQALVYSVSLIHRLEIAADDGYQDGIIVEILGMKVFSRVE